MALIDKKWLYLTAYKEGIKQLKGGQTEKKATNL